MRLRGYDNVQYKKLAKYMDMSLLHSREDLRTLLVAFTSAPLSMRKMANVILSDPIA